MMSEPAAVSPRETRHDLPEAEVVHGRRISLAWLIPLLALLGVGWISYSTWSERGLRVFVWFNEGHGIKVHDPVRYRGITVGSVTAIELAKDDEHVIVTLRLIQSAQRIVRSATLFWIVRPMLGTAGVAGLETLIGPRYVAVEPGPTGGLSQQRFLGLDRPPVVTDRQPGDLEIVIEASRRGSLHASAPVTYREIPIGTVLSVGLSSDGSSIESRVHIQKAYRELIRENTRFWDTGGLEADIGIRGIKVRLESLEQLILGGIALATPPLSISGDPVRTGHRFEMDDKPDSEWLSWEPTVIVGNRLLPAGSTVPTPFRAVLSWKEGLIFKGAHAAEGWLFQTDDGLIGPADLFTPPSDAEPESIHLEVGGANVDLSQTPTDLENGLAVYPHRLEGAIPLKDRNLRRPAEPEDAIAIGDPTGDPLPLSATRLADVSGKSSWLVDPVVQVARIWHGAAVLSRNDGKLIGFLLVEEKQTRVALVPE